MVVILESAVDVSGLAAAQTADVWGQALERGSVEALRGVVAAQSAVRTAQERLAVAVLVTWAEAVGAEDGWALVGSVLHAATAKALDKLHTLELQLTDRPVVTLELEN